MAFVMEKISEEDRAKYGLYVPEGHIPPDRWAIDREREAFLLRTGGLGRGEAYIYELNWKNTIIKLIVGQKEIEKNRWSISF